MTVDTWEHLHNLNHVDHEFQIVDNSFVCPSNLDSIWEWNTTPYQTSIQMFAIIPIALGAVYFLVSILVIGICCGRKWYKKRNEEQYQLQQSQSIQARLLNDNNMHPLDSPDANNQNNNYDNTQEEEPEDVNVDVNVVKLTFGASLSRYILSLISICLIIFSICIGIELDSTIIDVQTNWDDSYQPYNACIGYAESINNTLDSVINECEIIKKKNYPYSQCDVAVNFTNEIEIFAKQSLNEINNYLDDGQVISWGDSSYIDIYRTYLIYIGVSILSFMAIIIIITTFCVKALNTMERCICCNSFLSIILICGMLLIWIISSYQFAFSVQVSDSCHDPQNTILQGVNITDNENIDDTTIDIIKYYIYCDNAHNYNPLQNYTQNAINNLISINETIYSIMPYSEYCDISNETQILFNNYNETLHELMNLENSLKCDEINNYLTNMTNDLCVNGITEWFLLYLSSALVILLLIIRSYCICTKSEIDYDFTYNNYYYHQIFK